MKTEKFKKGGIIFREGDAGDCMYDVISGKIGIYADFETERQHLLTEYYPDQYFGEMGLLEHMPRSATAVALTSDTTLGVITEENFAEFFRKNPYRVLLILQQMSKNLRRRTNEYLDVCRSINELAVKEGVE